MYPIYIFFLNVYKIIMNFTTAITIAVTVDVIAYLVVMTFYVET